MPLLIDDAFIQNWHPKYDLTEDDEGKYQELVTLVPKEMTATGTILEETFLAIWKWKRAMRVIGHVLWIDMTPFTQRPSSNSCVAAEHEVAESLGGQRKVARFWCAYRFYPYSFYPPADHAHHRRAHSRDFMESRHCVH